MEPLVRKAGEEKCDFVCLPEIFSVHGISKSFAALAEDRNGETLRFLRRIAKTYSLNVVTSVLLKKGRRVSNTAVFINRNGETVGEYDKVHPAIGEKILPGNTFPVFEIEGVRVAAQICFDLNFPEGARILALKGAELIFWPTMWDGPSEHFVEMIPRVRAMENLVGLVSSSYIHYGSGSWESRNSLGQSAIISWDGQILAQTGFRTGLAVAEMNFDEVRSLQAGQKALWKMRRPECYGDLSRLRGWHDSAV